MRDSIGWSTKSLFGSIGEQGFPLPTNVDFIPANAEGDVITIKGDGVLWRGLNSETMQYWAYCYCSPLASVIDRLADADINGVLTVNNSDGNKSGSKAGKAIRNLLLNPNPLQTWEDFRAQQKTYLKIYGYCPIYATVPAGFQKYEAVALWNLNPFYCKPVENEKFDIYKKGQQNPIKEWDITIFGAVYTIPADKIFILKDSFVERNSDRTGLPVSKIAGLDWGISNICAAMEADNVLLRKKGPLGFISQDTPRDPVAGYIPLTQANKKEIQEDLQKYGLTWSQWQYVVSRHLIRWNPMSFNVRDLATKETIRQGIDMICDRFGYPAELMSGKNATYENRTSAEKFLYNTVVIPQNQREIRKLSSWFNEEDVVVFCNYEDYPILQESKVSLGESQKYLTEAYQQQFYDGVITLNQYRQNLEEETIPDDDIYYGTSEYITKYGKNIAPKNSGGAK